MNETFLIVDGHALIYRAFHAFPKTLVSQQGHLTNAVYGFSRILLKSIQDFAPKHLVVTFDHKEKTFRHQRFAEYKAQRPEMPPELISQTEVIFQMVETMNIPIFRQAGFEADDLIGTLTLLNEAQGLNNLIVSGDKDLFQLVTEKTHVFIPGRGKFSTDKEYTPTDVEKKMGVSVNQIVDLKALMGDASDNIPGVKGIGPKTAVNLLKQYGTLEALYERLDQISSTQPNAAKAAPDKLLSPLTISKLEANREPAFLSQELATIKRDIPLKYDLTNCEVRSYDKEKVVEIFTQLGFKSLLKFLPNDQFEESLQESLF